jgi:hypothetical protein
MVLSFDGVTQQLGAQLALPVNKMVEEEVNNCTSPGLHSQGIMEYGTAECALLSKLSPEVRVLSNFSRSSYQNTSEMQY